MSSFSLSSFLISQIWGVPYLLVYGAGIVLALVRWQRHPQVSLCALAAFLILTGNLLIAAGLQFWAMSSSAIDVGTIYRFAALGRSFLGAAAFGLLIAAVFGWRNVAYYD